MFIPALLFMYGISTGDIGSGTAYLFIGLGIWWWLGGWMDKPYSPNNVQTQRRCVWCLDEFKEGEKKLGDGFTQYGLEKLSFGNPAEDFFICGYCHEGLLSIAARGGDKAVMHAVLREAKGHPNVKRGRGFNDFIHAANQISN